MSRSLSSGGNCQDLENIGMVQARIGYHEIQKKRSLKLDEAWDVPALLLECRYTS